MSEEKMTVVNQTNTGNSSGNAAIRVDKIDNLTINQHTSSFPSLFKKVDDFKDMLMHFSKIVALLLLADFIFCLVVPFLLNYSFVINNKISMLEIYMVSRMLFLIVLGIVGLYTFSKIFLVEDKLSKIQALLISSFCLLDISVRLLF
jgi:hypothetical protein